MSVQQGPWATLVHKFVELCSNVNDEHCPIDSKLSGRGITGLPQVNAPISKYIIGQSYIVCVLIKKLVSQVKNCVMADLFGNLTFVI